MNIELQALEPQDELQLEDLQVRHRTSPVCVKTVHYRATIAGEEVGFVALDRWPEPQVDALVIYEIYVTKAHRQKGIGKAVLCEIEDIAKTEGFSSLKLRPSPLDKDVTERWLVAWYERTGFRWVRNVPGEMEKQLDDTHRNSSSARSGSTLDRGRTWPSDVGEHLFPLKVLEPLVRQRSTAFLCGGSFPIVPLDISQMSRTRLSPCRSGGREW